MAPPAGGTAPDASDRDDAAPEDAGDGGTVAAAGDVAGDVLAGAQGGTASAAGQADDEGTGERGDEAGVHDPLSAGSAPASGSPWAPAANAEPGAHQNSAASGDAPGGGAAPDSAAARVFDVPTTRRRTVIFEEDDDLDVPDFLK